MLFEEIFVVINKEDLNNIPQNARNIFCRSEYIKKFINKEKFNVITPDAKKTCIQSEELLSLENKLTEFIIDKTINLYKTSYIYSLEELLKPYLVQRISSYLYLKSVIPESKKYFIRKKGFWRCLDFKEDLIIEIENKLCLEEDSSHFLIRESTASGYYWLDYLLGNVQKLLLRIHLKKIKKLFIFTVKKSYFFGHLTELLQIDKKNIIFPYLGNNRFKYLYCILNQILSFFNKNELYLGFFIIPKNLSLNYSFEKSIFLDLKNLKIFSEIYSKLLAHDLNLYLSKTTAFYKYIQSIFATIKIDINLISHAKRFPKTYAISEALENLGYKNYLISHGSHTCQEGTQIDKIAADQLALGLVYSNSKNTILCSQSLFSDRYLEMMGKKYVKIYPIENISNNKLKDKENLSLKNKFEKLRILHACTVKSMGIRRYIYHSSSEYICHLFNICRKLKKIKKNIIFVVRIRPVINEINEEFLKSTLKEFRDFVEFSTENSFLDELSNSDCVIALSSTTLEQALINNIPSMSLGETGYDHLSFYKNKILPKSHYKYKELNNIEKILGKKFVFLSNHERENVIDFLDFLYSK